MEGIGKGIFKAFTNVSHAAHPGSLITLIGFFKEAFRRDRTRIGHGKVGQRKPGEISLPGDLKDALGENGDQFDLSFHTFLIDPLDTFKASTGGEEIDLSGKMIRESISKEEGDGGTRGNGRIRNEPDLSPVFSDKILSPDLPVQSFSVEDSLQFDKSSRQENPIIGGSVSESLLKVKGISSPENEILGTVLCFELFKEEFDEEVGEITNHIKFRPSADPSPEEKRLAHFALHHIDERRKDRIVSEIPHLP
jgi:hypothetical protein